MLNISRFEREPTHIGICLRDSFTERSAEAKKLSMSICKNKTSLFYESIHQLKKEESKCVKLSFYCYVFTLYSFRFHIIYLDKGQVMKQLFKKLLGMKEEEKVVTSPPGRTFKRILTGDYFGCEKNETDTDKITQAKQNKIDQIKELELLPMSIRYSYMKSSVTSVHVAFQKEVHNKNWNMTHVTEISFTVYASDFEEFEQMSEVRLRDDFRDLTAYEKDDDYKGEERRKGNRGN